MKLFKCTVEAYPNNCYVNTLLIVANDKEDAHNQIVESRVDKYNKKPEVKYTSRLEEVSVDITKRGIVKVGHGSSDIDFHSLDD